MTWPVKEMNIVDLRLDAQNVRLQMENPNIGQSELIEDMFMNEDALSLAESIAREGIYQHELFIVAEIDKQTVVLEGNRRLSALKALADPNLIPKYKAKLAELVRTSEVLPIDSVTVRVAPSREDASRTIANIHTTTAKRKWSPLRQARFYYAQFESGAKTIERLIADYSPIPVRDFISMWEMHHIVDSIDYEDDAIQRRVNRQNAGWITNFERVYKHPDFAKRFGVGFDENGQVVVHSKRDEFDQAIKAVIKDLLTVENSRSLNKSEDIAKKIEKWSAPIVTQNSSDTGLKAADFDSINNNDGKGIKGPPSNKLGPKFLVPAQLPGLKARAEELVTLNYFKFPNAALDLMRTMLECTLDAYFEQKGIKVVSKASPGQYNLQNLLDTAAAHFKEGQEANAKILQVIGGIQSRTLGPGTSRLMNAENHNYRISVSVAEAKSSFDMIRPLLDHALIRLNEKYADTD